MNIRLAALSLVLAAACGVAAQDRPLAPSEAPKAMKLPEGFKATLFAGEPDVVQPIAGSFDDRGRLWVVECLSYPKWSDKPEGNDRVIMFDDTDGDGTFDKRTVVFDKGANLSGIELGFGGIWLCSIPNLLFIPCDINADVPKIGKPEVVLDGWSLKCRHNVVNGLLWGPDGWLYGCNGIVDTSKVGKPGTPDADRIPMNCGVWRYHPTRRIFEQFAHGTTNPFGLDFDDFGECLMTNCVIGHLWHVQPNAHFERMYGQDLNPNTYALMPQCADHIHWGGGHWTQSRGGKGVHSEAGGGHAHVGCMVYLGENWPATYRNGVFMLNLHGSRMNHDRLVRSGSGYVAKHEPDFMLANDPWFRGIFVKQGPDGGVFVSDWTDTGECHNYEKVDPSNGRLYKITYGKTKPWSGNLAGLKDLELAKLQGSDNEWLVRHARRLLQERVITGRLADDAAKEMRSLLANERVEKKLRGLWALYVTGELDVATLAAQIDKSRDDMVRAWAIRLAVNSRAPDASILNLMQQLAEKDPSTFVKRIIAASLPRVPVEQRWPIAMKLVRNAIEPDDVPGQLMAWYGLEALPAADPARGVKLLADAKVPVVQEFITRRLVTLPDGKPLAQLEPILNLLAARPADAASLPILKGIQDALLGRRQLEAPPAWAPAYANLMKSTSPDVRDRAAKLAVIFGDAAAIASLQKLVSDRGTTTSKRYDALQALMIRQTPDLQALLRDLLDDNAMRGSAIRALAAFKNDETPKTLLAIYPKLSTSEKTDVVQTLASRPAWALALLNAIDGKQIPRDDVSVFTARQIQGLKDKKVQERLTLVWGQIKPASKEKVELIAKYKTVLTAEYLKSADLVQGRVVFVKNCVACHRLYDDGGNIGPALTGAQRHNLDYVLENMIDPSAVVSRDYQMTKIETLSGRTITGIVKQETEKAVTVQTPNEVIILPKDEIETRTQSPLSMMPEGVLDKLSAVELRDLVAYLASKDQVPLPKGP